MVTTECGIDADHGGRPLDSSEVAFAARHGVFVGYSALADGRLDHEALSAAYRDLHRAHVSLGFRIVPDGTGLSFAPGVGPVGEPRVVTGEDPRRVLTGSTEVFEQADRLAHLDVVTGADLVRVSLLVHHSIADGRHGMALMTELWERYGSYERNGTALPHPARAFPVSEENLLGLAHPAPMFGPGDTVAGGAVAARVAPRLAVPPGYRFSAAETSDLRDRAKQAGLTLNAYVSAAIARAHDERGETPLLYTYPVDLRGSAEPSVPVTGVTNLIGNAVVSVPAGEALVDSAHRIRNALSEDIASGAVIDARPGGVSPVMEADDSGHYVFSTNWGVVPRMNGAEGLSIIDFDGFFSQPLPVAAYAESSGRSYRAYVIHTFEGRLNIAVVDHRQGEGSDLVERIRRELTATLVR